MAKINLYLDDRKLRKDGTAPIKIVVRNLGKTAQYNLDVYAKPEQWDAECSRLRDFPKHKYKEHPNKRVINDFLANIMVNVQTHVYTLPLRMSATDIRDSIDRYLNKDFYEKKRLEAEEKRKAENLFMVRFQQFADSRNAKRTREMYSATMSSIRKYDENADDLKFEDITEEWLVRYDKFLQKTSPSLNGRAIHYRNIRAVFNYALRKLKITTHYPFYDFKIRTEETAKRSLSIDQIRQLHSMALYSSVRSADAVRLRAYVDMFMLSIFLCGIRPIDLANLKKKNIVGDRIEYRSMKTGTFYSVKMEPEALELINRHSGKGEYLVFINEYYKDYRTFFKQSNNALKNIGKHRSGLGRGGGHLVGESLFPGLSAYWSRHSWATLAAELDIPIETVSKGLGHMIGEEMTLVYVAYRQKKVDDANRKIIDYILNCPSTMLTEKTPAEGEK